jgi:hypothetical protein
MPRHHILQHYLWCSQGSSDIVIINQYWTDQQFQAGLPRASVQNQEMNMQHFNKLELVTALILLLGSQQALAYVGPGLGAGSLGVILGLLGSVLLALFAFFWYPIKRMLSKKDKDEEATAEVTAESSEKAEQTTAPDA